MAATYVAGGNNLDSVPGCVSSPDGVAWTRFDPGVAWPRSYPVLVSIYEPSNAVFVFGGGVFDAEGEIAFSTDGGSTWTSLKIDDGFNAAGGIKSLTFGAGVFVLGDVVGQIWTSVDLVTWTFRTDGSIQPAPAFQPWNGMAFGAGLFVAVSRFGYLFTSPDAVTWTQRASGFGSFPNGDIQAVAFGQNQFVAVGNDGKIATSPDGITWTQQTSNTANRINGVAFDGSGLWVAVTSFAPDSITILTSPDGVTWTPANSFGADVDVRGVDFGNFGWVAVGGISTTAPPFPLSGQANIALSLDGLTWTQETTNYETDDSVLAVAGVLGVTPVFPNCNNPPNGAVGIPYSHTFTASGGVAPYSFAISGGSLPPNLFLDLGGTVSGVPHGNGIYTFDLFATDNVGSTGTITCSITIAPGVIGNAGGGGSGAGVGGGFAATGLSQGLPIEGCGCCPPIKRPFHRPKRKIEFDAPPPGSKHVNVLGTAVGPATTVPVVLVEYHVPNNRLFQLDGLIFDPALIANWTPGDGNVIFSVTIDRSPNSFAAQGVPFKDFGVVTVPLGSFRGGPWPVPVADRMVIESRSVVRILVQTDPTQITPGVGTRFNAELHGWEWSAP